MALVAWLACLTAPLHAQNAGNYSGNYTGDFSGVWSFTVDGSGNLTGRAVDAYGEVTTGSGSVQATGGFAMVMAAGSDTTFTGQINATGNVTGTWEDSYWLASGTVSGSRLPTTVAQYAGTYSGTLAGAFSGTWSSTIDSAGNWTGSGTVPGLGTFGVNGIVSGTGAITTYIEAGGILTGQINASGQASGTWTDYEFSGTFTGTRTSTPPPEISVEQPAATNIADGGTKDFGPVNLGSSSPLTFTIKNTGAASLTGLAITKDGTHLADFTIGSLGATTVAADASTTFTVTFAPGAAGSRTAAIHIASNDADENPFDISLSGTGGVAISLPAALDQPTWTFANSGSLPWTGQSTVTHDSVDAAKSGAITHSQSSEMTTTVTGPGTVSFWWKVSSESGYDYLRFYIDGSKQSGEISGTVDWTQKSYTLTAGNHTLKWAYSKDSSDSAGSDCGWVDQVVFVPAAAVPEISVEQPVGTNIADGGSKGFGSLNTGSSTSLTFTIKNTGDANLTGLAITKDGPNEANFTVGALGSTTLAAGASTSFTVTFAPGAAGSRSAAIHIASNDADENPFDINLTGTATVPALVPGELAAPRMAITGGNVNLTVQPSVAGRSYQLQVSDTMAPGTWQDVGAVRMGDGNNLVISIPYVAAVRQRFYRLALAGVSTVPTPSESFALIPAGWFEMGDSFNEGWADERPVHSVFLSAFAIGRNEVTRRRWYPVAQWAGAHGYDLVEVDYSNGLQADYPIHFVTWHSVVKWCNARSEMEGLAPCYTVAGAIYRTGNNNNVACDLGADGYRLPTEAEWEKAARGGLTEKRFPWGDTISHSWANYKSSASYYYDVSPTRGDHPLYNAAPAPVGSLAPNGYGLYDLGGNVSEWCWDWMGYYYSVSPQTDPRGPSTGEERVARDGDWQNTAVYGRVAYRSSGWPGQNWVDYGGFRLARSATP